MNGILKAAHVEKQAVNAAELALINKQALRELEAEEGFYLPHGSLRQSGRSGS